MREILINLDVIAANLQTMRGHCPTAMICGVVKANAYGHGMIEVAKRLQAEKIDYLGVADLDEAIELRQNGITIPVLAWLHEYEEDFVAGVENSIEIGVATVRQLDRVAAAASKLKTTAVVHLKVDTGLNRNGSTLADWPHLIRAAVDLQNQNLISVKGVFSHLSTTSPEDDLHQIELFDDAVAAAKASGLDIELRHLTASDGSLTYPQAHYEMVRLGVSLYGLSPWTDHTSADYGLIPAMTAVSSVVQVKEVPAGQGVSYGYLYRTSAATRLALIPVGYAEGLPRNASGKAEVSINGRRYPILSRIAMDQIIIDVDDSHVQPGDKVTIFGDPATGVPSADELAIAAETINYEIVTRIGGRFKRSYIGNKA
ncbi:MAG: hypothetical protein RL556_95 [Actinomycetota bacterium]|jgi:alanine racemase